MWLLFMWLIVAPDLDTRPHSRVGGSIYDLAQDVERVGVVAAVSVAAYLIGAVSGELADVLRRAGNKLWQARLGPTFMVTAEEEIRRLWGSEQVKERYEAALSNIETAAPDMPGPDLPQRFAKELTDRAIAADDEAVRELGLPATLLVGKQPQLFAEVDRLRAEGELRLAVVPPLAATTVLLAVLQTPPWEHLLWFVALLAVFPLYFQGIRREQDSKKLIADAIDVGQIEAPSLTKFDAWLNSQRQEIDRVLRPPEYA
jgi:hypothetical protein